MTKRFLIGFADTEGTPNRKNSKSSLWNMFVIFRFVVYGKKALSTFHTSNLSLPKHLGDKNDVLAPLDTFNSSLNFIKHMYKVDEIYIFFWNAPHDKGVLRHYNDELGFKALDLLHWARQFKTIHDPPISSFSLNKLNDRFNNQDSFSWSKQHTALGDTLTMMSLLSPISKITNDGDLLKSILGLHYDISIEGPNPDLFHDETKTGRSRTTCEKTKGVVPPKKCGEPGKCEHSITGDCNGDETKKHGDGNSEGLRDSECKIRESGEEGRVSGICKVM